MSDSETLQIAEIPYPSGNLQFRYARKMSLDAMVEVYAAVTEAITGGA